MLDSPIQAVGVLLVAALGFVALHGEQFGAAGLCFSVAATLAVSLLRGGGVLAAGRHYRAGRGERALRLLSIVPFRGRLLAGGIRAYYHLLRAACRLDREEWALVLPEGEAVLALRRTQPANVSTAHAAMAVACLELGDTARAARHVAEAKRLPHKPGLDRRIAEVERRLADGGAE